LITNIIVFIKDLVVAFFFPNKKLQKLEIKSARQEYLEQKLLEKLDKIKNLQEKLQSQIIVQRVKVTHWQEKKTRKNSNPNQSN
ncbi:MAG: hypothetical protein ACQBVK_03150, partial [Candidatus Phytoplasma sp. TWB_XP]